MSLNMYVQCLRITCGWQGARLRAENTSPCRSKGINQQCLRCVGEQSGQHKHIHQRLAHAALSQDFTDEFYWLDFKRLKLIVCFFFFLQLIVCFSFFLFLVQCLPLGPHIKETFIHLALVIPLVLADIQWQLAFHSRTNYAWNLVQIIFPQT